MPAPLNGGAPFNLGRFAGPPPVVVASEILDSPMGASARRAVWRCVGALPALTVVAGLFADFDLAAIAETRSTIERQFINGCVGDLQKPLARQMSRGRTVFTNVGLITCIKEIVQYAAEDSMVELTAGDLTRCVLGINQDNDRVDPAVMARATNPSGVDIEALRADADELSLDFVAQGLFDYTDTLETLACSVQEIWRSGWAPGTPQKVVDALGASPADLFAEVTGVQLDDFVALAWFFWNAARNDGQVGFDAGLIDATGLSPNTIETFRRQCTLSLSELRDRLADERMSNAATPWARYTLQEFPFLRLNDGSVLMLRLQYVIQRLFGDLLYLKVHDALKVSDPKRADKFKNAMNAIHESRVGSVLQRIAAHEARFGGAVVITEEEMKAAWSNRRGEHPKICDYAFVQGDHAILIDANNRSLPKKFADRSAAGSDLHDEIQNMFAATKFGQLTSTARQFRSHGWADTDGNALITDRTKFLPFVVTPNAGIPSNMFTERLIMAKAIPLIAEFNSKVLPPTILTWRDLQILEGIAEQGKGGRVIELLIMWRISNYRMLTQGRGLPRSLTDFIDETFTLGHPMPAHDQTVGTKFLQAIHTHAQRLFNDAEGAQ
ncbi:hypothetical protein [Mycolicibacterium arseniciresistens]|uniref:Uncharacterized protein n=1 Tax=Mycolicibacterium arseniciresistens TaxID=3062257 RepID=A0ABT8UF01_9MYCO|nr:hypothetical protein [Mycolicibacterium arseniciresistens]MDO3635756.1 hypothetical protein [Mycolicibacterium arseniciresistens]